MIVAIITTITTVSICHHYHRHRESSILLLLLSSLSIVAAYCYQYHCDYTIHYLIPHFFAMVGLSENGLSHKLNQSSASRCDVSWRT